MIIRRLVRLKIHQGKTDKIAVRTNAKSYKGWWVVEYEEGVWEQEDLMEAYVGHLYEGEVASYIYDHRIMTEEEYEEWTTITETTVSG